MSPRPSKTIKGRPRPTTAKLPRGGVVGALALHAALGAALLITFNRSLDFPVESHTVPVDLITVTNQTNIRAEAPPVPPPPKPVPDTPPPPPKMVDAEPAPDVAPPKFQILPDKAPDKPQEKPADKKLDVAALINQLAAPKPVKDAKAGPRVIQGIGNQNLMTADIADALKSQIYRCWSPPLGAPNAADLVVDFTLNLNPDGTVGRLQLQTLSGNSYTRAAAEAASRAIYQCQPYRLPQNRYDDWKEISRMRFDPRQLMEQ